MHLVSSSVPYLPAENVSVVDNTGALLTDTEGENAMTLTTAQAEHKRSLEMSYNQRIEQILATIVGLGNVRSEVDITLDFTEVETTYEEFDKAGVGPRTRSESLDFEQEAAIDAEGLPGSFSIRRLPHQILLHRATCSVMEMERAPMFLAHRLLGTTSSIERFAMLSNRWVPSSGFPSLS